VAYGDNRSELASDTFDSSIDGNWAVGEGDWDNMQWLTGGHVEPIGNTSCAMRRSGETYADDQYSILTINAMTTNSDWVAATVRMASGVDESAYVCYYDTELNEYSIYEFDSAFGATLLNSVANDTTALQAGDTLTAEVEGITIRLGTNEGSGDGQRLTTTDTTITSGDPGMHIFQGLNESSITAWSGGDIGAGAGIPIYMHHHLQHNLG